MEVRTQQDGVACEFDHCRHVICVLLFCLQTVRIGCGEQREWLLSNQDKESRFINDEEVSSTVSIMMVCKPL